MQLPETQAEKRQGMIGRRILSISARQGTEGLGPSEQLDWNSHTNSARELGFDMLAVPVEYFGTEQAVKACMHACAESKLDLMVDVSVSGAAERESLPWSRELASFGGTLAYLLRDLHKIGQAAARRHIEVLRETRPEVLITVWTPGMSPKQLAGIAEAGVDAVYSSLPWWNYQDAWLTEEYERLVAVAPVIAPIADARAPSSDRRAHPQKSHVSDQEIVRRMAVAGVAADGILVPAERVSALEGNIHARELLERTLPTEVAVGARRITGPLSAVTALLRDGPDGHLILLNPDGHRPATIEADLLELRLPDGVVLQNADVSVVELPPGGWEFLPLQRRPYIAKLGTTSSQTRRSLAAAIRRPRIAIEDVRPSVDGGAFSVKRTLGETVTITANVFMDGHEQLAAEALWRSVDEPDWHRAPMVPLGNDAWQAQIRPRRLGRYVFAIRAWWDEWGSFRTQLEKKAAAGTDVRLEVEEARHTLVAHLERAVSDKAPEKAAAVSVIEAALETVGMPTGERPTPKRRRTRKGPGSQEGAASAEPLAFPPATADQVAMLLTSGLAEAIAMVEERPFETQTEEEYPLCIERVEASFASWYEIFPRSQSSVPGQHGTLRDVIERLPQIRRMGFDVLYFPPIHPIGLKNRKGRNNSLKAEPGDPGSPYAIGSSDGGHDALHPELGTLDDFHALVAAAKEHGLELALDFAIQCSPDHPWLRENPDWFNWRVDGTLKYAENPPKRYEDIVNPDFYSAAASVPRQSALWRALRDVVLFWIAQGVRIFRVDNPHTKPLPFWEWMIGEVRDRHPDVIFLSEAFTRPAMMYRLAKIGFSQSYTYFTWRNTKDELTDYMTELNREPVRDFFRPNFFVNTPDINPWFLQTSGRPGFLIRAVLAGTLSGSWGVYNGFELCVADAVPGKEEYLDSEKYQLRHWNMQAPGNIIEEISWLNRIRRSHPALQSHLGVRFHGVDNNQILYYSRHSAHGDSIVLVAVSLDPHHRQGGTLNLPRWEWGLAHDAPLRLHDLYEETHFTLWGQSHHIELAPERPFVVWAIEKEPRGAV